MGRPKGDPVDGVLLLDKPAGLTSNAALGKARRLLGARKAGHTGTLDPLATGLLPLTFGEATKFSADLLDADKAYEARVQFGVTTATGDAEGEVTARRPVTFDRAQIEAALLRFTGQIEQVPPMHSALKRDGRPLYEYARAGHSVERAPRPVTIHAIDVLSVDAQPDAPPGAAGSVRVTLRVTCSKSTYVRTLAEDIGRRLGCGAHLSALRRERVGALLLERAVTLEALEAQAPEARAASLLPADLMLGALRNVDLEAAMAQRFLHGQRLRLAPAGERAAHRGGERVRVYRAGTLLGTGLLDDGLLVPQRLIDTAGALATSPR